MAAPAVVRPPGPKGKPIVGSLPDFREGALSFLTQSAAQYGNLIHYKMGPYHTYLVNHPDLIKDVLITHHDKFGKGRILEKAQGLLGQGLLTSEGQFHLRQRRLAQPAFHRQRLMSYGEKMVACGLLCRDRWEDGQTIELQSEMMRLTLDVVCRTLFSKDVEHEAGEIGTAMVHVMNMFDTLLLPWSDYLLKLPIPKIRRYLRAKERLDATIYGMIAERRQSGEDRGDLLSMLLLAQDEQGTGSMSDVQVRDEALTIFLAGHETTANALMWTWYLLSQHPEVERRLHEEIDTVLAGRVPTVEDLPQLRYTEQVLAETMRLYPPAWAIGRRVQHALTLGGYDIPVDSLVVISPYVTQRDPRFWPDPERFDPNRWTPEAREARPKYTYLPFSAGPRLCIGERFAWMEGTLLIAAIAQKWALSLVPGQKIAVAPLITMRSKHGIRVQATRRRT